MASLTADMRVLAQRADAPGIDFIGKLEKSKFVGIINPYHLTNKYKVAPARLRSLPSRKQEDLFTLASGGKDMKDIHMQPHRRPGSSPESRKFRLSPIGTYESKQ